MVEDIRTVGLDKKALELDNSTVFHKGKEQKSFLIIWPHFSTKDFPKMQQITITINRCHIYRYFEFLEMYLLFSEKIL